VEFSGYCMSFGAGTGSSSKARKEIIAELTAWLHRSVVWINLRYEKTNSEAHPIQYTFHRGTKSNLRATPVSATAVVNTNIIRIKCFCRSKFCSRISMCFAVRAPSWANLQAKSTSTH